MVYPHTAEKITDKRRELKNNFHRWKGINDSRAGFDANALNKRYHSSRSHLTSQPASIATSLGIYDDSDHSVIRTEKGSDEQGVALSTLPVLHRQSSRMRPDQTYSASSFTLNVNAFGGVGLIFKSAFHRFFSSLPTFIHILTVRIGSIYGSSGYGRLYSIPLVRSHQRTADAAATTPTVKVVSVGSSDVPARLGPKAAALAWPEPAPAFSRAGPSQSRHSRLGPGPARPKPRLLQISR
jgi:hypothetical protein